MMYPCNKCLENNWSFVKNDDLIEATCNLCGNSVEFSARRKTIEKSKDLATGQTCRKCGNKITIKETKRKPKQLRKRYYYTAYYYCSNCRTIYYSNRFKIVNKTLSSNKLTLF